MDPAVQRFACTQCGKCCNRSPEVELSEAAALADVFAFRLLFRQYWLPNTPDGRRDGGHVAANPSAVFYESRRLLGAFAARKSAVKVRRDGKPVDYTKYLVISALALDTTPGVCSALNERRCGIYDRRPLSCRSVPLHYSRPEASAENDLAAFVETDGYRCDTSETAPVVLGQGRIVDPDLRATRAEALALAVRDRGWGQAIVRRMSQTSSSDQSLPTLAQIDAAAPHGALTTSMRVAWGVATEIGLMDGEECDRLIQRQLKAIDHGLRQRTCPADSRETLVEMNAEYQRYLTRGRVPLANV